MKYAYKSTFFPAPVIERSYPALVVLEEERGLGAPLRALTGLLAQTLRADFGDAVIVVHVVPETARISLDDFHTDGEQVDHVSVAIPTDPIMATLAMHPRLLRLVERYAYVFLDTSAMSRDFTRVLVSHLASADLGDVVRRLVFLTRSQAAPPFSPGWCALRTDLIAPYRLAPIAAAALGLGERRSLRHYVNETRHLAADLLSRLGGAAVEPQGEPYPPERVTPEWCRARLDLAALTAMPSPELGSLPLGARETIARWGRALTRRRVGIALGGSGSWGYAHVALMEALCDHGVPIDLIGGSSSGSLMGAYYAALGRPGLELLIKRSRRFARAAILSTITSTTVDLTVDADLGPVLLEDLEVVLLPVATNLSRGQAEVITRSIIGAAVRASSSVPGFFASTITRNGLYVDGAITDNVPVILVERMGADLLIACNPLPPPPSVRVRTPGSPLQDFLAEFNPMDRIRDVAVSFALMFHGFGECEAAPTRVIYDPAPQDFTLFRTFDFHRAQEIVDTVKAEVAFQEAIQQSIASWKKLSRPRRARGGAG